MLEMFEELDPVNAAIVSILYDERWYGDSPPHWIIGAGKRWQRPSQTAEQASEQREKTEKLLHLYGSRGSNDSHVLNSIRRKIESCHQNHRCGSGGCPECTRALQRWFVENVHKAAEALPITPTLFGENSRELILLSLVPDYAETDATSPTMNWEKVVTRLCQDMASVGISWGIGGSDFSVNIDKMHGAAPILQGQFWMLIKEPQIKWEGQLKALINASRKIRRPITKSKYISRQAQLAYGIKNEFTKRETYIKRTKLRNPHMNTREKKLRGDLWLKLMLFLDHIGLEGRLIEHNAFSFNSQGWPQATLGRVPNTNGFGQSADRSKSLVKRSFYRGKLGSCTRF